MKETGKIKTGSRAIGLALALSVGQPTLAQSSTPSAEQYAGQGNGQTSGQTGGQNAPLHETSGSLRVTGNAMRFTVVADRADVRDTIKLLFDQAERQFTFDNNVVGQVTLRLQDQPLDVTLYAICRQTFLKYQTDPVTKITFFSRDDAALRESFTRLKLLDVRLRDQIRIMGLSLPPETMSQRSTFDVTQNGAMNRESNQGIVPGGGGFGGGSSSPTGRASSAAPTEKIPNAALDRSRPRSQKTSKVASEATQDRLQNRVSMTPAPVAEANEGTERSESVQVKDLLQQNRFVSFRIPTDKPEPTVDVLKSMAKQANVTMLIDPGVPTGKKFMTRGSLSPRSLPDALNLIAPYARLEWKWVGDTIYVTTAPDFEVMFGENPTSAVISGPKPPTRTPKKGETSPK